jgi:hypothetical protein
MYKYLVLLAILAGCSGGSSGGKPPIEPPPPPPPPPPPTNCQFSVTWVNPTQDINDNELGPTDLIAASAFFFRVPEAPREAEFIYGLDAYTLNFTFVGGEESIDITYYVWLTVSNEHGESDPSNQVEKICEPY